MCHVSAFSSPLRLIALFNSYASILQIVLKTCFLFLDTRKCIDHARFMLPRRKCRPVKCTLQMSPHCKERTLTHHDNIILSDHLSDCISSVHAKRLQRSPFSFSTLYGKGQCRISIKTCFDADT